MSEQPIGEGRAVVFAVENMDRACKFYSEVLGFRLTRRDGDRWARFETGSVIIALAGRDQRTLGTPPAITIKVPDLARARDQLKARGAAIGDERSGDLETSFPVKDPDGHVLHVFVPKADTAKG